jgi:hypothetical protein
MNKQEKEIIEKLYWILKQNKEEHILINRTMLILKAVLQKNYKVAYFLLKRRVS